MYYRSERYRLPVPIAGTEFDEVEEKKLADVLDRLIYHIIQIQTPEGKGCGVVKEGIYSSDFADNNSIVYLNPTDTFPSLLAFVGYKPVYSNEQIVWTGLENNKTYYLYIRTIETEDESTAWQGVFETVAATAPVDSSSYLLLAIAITTDSSISVNANPQGKKYIRLLTDYDADMDGVVDDAEKISGKTLDYILDRSHHIGKIDWIDISTEIHKIVTEDLSENERVSLRFKEIFGDFWVEGETPQTSSTLTHTIPEQKIIIAGQRVVVPQQEITYLVNKDNYVDVDKNGQYHITAVEIGSPAPPVSSEMYRLFKVETRYAENAHGRIWIQRQPSAGDIVKIYGYTFTATNNLSEVLPGNQKFYTGAADNPSGWRQCAISLINAINSSPCPILASLGSSPNEIYLTSQKQGESGNEEIVLTTARPGDITAEGMWKGHSDCITKVVDLRAKLYPYWKEPVKSKDDLPHTTTLGETRLVLDENAIYRYDTTPKQGIGKIKLFSLPEHGDRIKIGKIVVEATSGVTSEELKQFGIYTEGYENENINQTLANLKKVIESSYYPRSELTCSFIQADELLVKTIGTSSEENRPIQLLRGSVSRYALSGIEGAGESTGWIPVSAKSVEETKTVVKRGHTYAYSGQEIVWTDAFEDNLIFVFKNGVLQERDINYTTIGYSGLQFSPGLNENDEISWFIFNNKVDLQTKPLQEYTFVTVEKHPELVKSLDLETYHIFHDELKHEAVPIPDPGDRYVHRGEYKVLGDHIYDDLAHSFATELVYKWKILRGTTSEKFVIQAADVNDFSNLIFDYDSSTVKADQGEFRYYAGEQPYVNIYSTDENRFNYATVISGIDEGGIFYLGRQIYKGDFSGSSWTRETVETGVNLNGLVLYSGKLYSATDNCKLYRKDENWNFVISPPGTSIKSLSTWNDKLAIGTDGEVYLYHSGLGLTDKPAVDVPTQYVSALCEYGGMLFVGTESPGNIYKFDGEKTTLDFSTGTTRVNAFYVYQGRLYAGASNGNIYVKAGINNDWHLEFSSGDTAIYSFAEYRGTLYAGGYNKIFRKDPTGWVVEQAFNENSPIYLVATNDNLFASSRGKIYAKIADLGWQLVPQTGLNTTFLADHEIRFVLKDQEKIRAVKRAGNLFVRYKQYPTDNVWRYMSYPMTMTTLDHGLLGGLLDDDHPQYYNRERLMSEDFSFATASGVPFATAGETYITYEDETERLPYSYPLETISIEHDKYPHSGVPGIVWSIEDYQDPLIRLRGNVRIEGQSGIAVTFYSGLDVEERITIWASGIEITGYGSGATTFLDLVDTPDSYAGQAGKVVKVRADETGLEFGEVSGGGISSIDVKKDGVLVVSTSTLNFSGAGVSVTNDEGTAKIDIETPSHALSHQQGGSDEINVTGLHGLLADAQKINVRSDAGLVGTRRNIHFSGVGVQVWEIPAADEILVNIPGGGGGSGGGGINGIDIKKDGVLVVGSATKLNFSGDGVSVSDSGAGEALVNISGVLVGGKSYRTFTVTDWSSDSEGYYFMFTHNLGTTNVIIAVYENNIQVIPDATEIVDENNVRIRATETFEGKIIVWGYVGEKSYRTFTVTDWSSDSEGYYLMFTHNLGTTDIITSVYENNIQVIPDAIEIVDENNVRIRATETFSGKIITWR